MKRISPWLIVGLIIGCGNDKVVRGFKKVASLLDKGEADGPVDLVFFPDGSGAYLVGYRDGTVEWRGADHKVLDTTEIAVRRGNECGLLALEIDPSVASNDRFYASYCVPDGDVETTTFTWPSGGEASTPSTLIETPAAPNNYHNHEDLGFDDAGNLWLSLGDGNTPNTPQDLGDLRGKIVRITPTPGEAEPYAIPSDNPFVGVEGVRPEILAYGMKSPFRGDFGAGAWFFGDVGIDSYEEINATTLAGPHNFGYPLCEGPMRLDDYDPTNDPCNLGPEDDYGAPQIYYEQENYDQDVVKDDDDVERGTLWAVVGGVYYDGERYDGDLSGHFIWGDYGRGFVRAARWDGSKLTGDRHLAHLARITAFAMSPDGYVYAVSGGGLYRLSE